MNDSSLRSDFFLPRRSSPQRRFFGSTLLAAGAVLAMLSPASGSVLYSNSGPITANETGGGSNLSGMALSKDGTSTGTLYFKYVLVNPASNSTNENYYAGMQLWEGGSERLGVGNGWGPYAYSAFSTASGDLDLHSATPEAGQVYQLVRGTDVTTIVFKVEFVAGGNDNVTVWLNPNLSLQESAQNPALMSTFQANATFNQIHLREGGGGGGWTFSDIAVADTGWDTGFFAAPPDSDNDGLPDVWENVIIAHAAGLGNTLTLADIKGPNDAPATSDYDSDGATDATEFALATDPTDPDSDNDLLADGVETKTGLWVNATNTGTDPLAADSDGDGFGDGVESNSGTYNGLTDPGTDPNKLDTDGDTHADQFEAIMGSDPNSAFSTPPQGDLAVIGTDSFTYDDGSPEGRNGGTGFDFDNSLINNTFYGHTPTVSDWDVVFGTPTVTGGKLETMTSGAKREFNGPGEGVVVGGDEYIGAVRPGGDVNSQVVYLRADLTRAAGAEWSGISVYDFGAERLFFGVPGQIGPSGAREFGIEESGVGITFKAGSPLQAWSNQAYTIVAKLDYANQLLSLWVDPDLTKTEAENTPYVTRVYTGTNWATAMRIASGGTGAVSWDNAVAARQWSALGVFPGTPSNSYQHWIVSYPGVGGATAFGQDADGDGIPNGVESVLGTDPSVASVGLRETAHDGNAFTFRHSRSNNLAYDVTATYEWSTDMANWSASGGTNGEGVSVTIAAATLTDNEAPALDEIEVTATVTEGQATELFVRMRANQ